MDNERFFEMLSQAEKEGSNLRSTVDVNGAIFIYHITNSDLHMRFIPTALLDVENSPVAIVWFSTYGVSNPFVYSILLPIDTGTLDNVMFKTLTLMLQRILMQHVNEQYRGHKQIGKILFSANTPKVNNADISTTIVTTEGETLFTFFKEDQAITGCVVHADTCVYLDEQSILSSQMYAYLPSIVAMWRGQQKAKPRNVITPITPRKHL